MDFYGTVVHEDGEVIRRICDVISKTGITSNQSEIGAYWWKLFQEFYIHSYGESFKTQRDLEFESLQKTILHFKSTADASVLSELMYAYWQKPPIFEDAKQFLCSCHLPVHIVSNIDRNDILQAIEYHELKVANIFTSEDAKSYKPRKELFELALRETGLYPNEVVHIGDSLSSDIAGASLVGINAIWLNRNSRKVPEGVASVESLAEVCKTSLLRNLF